MLSALFPSLPSADLEIRGAKGDQGDRCHAMPGEQPSSALSKHSKTIMEVSTVGAKGSNLSATPKNIAFDRAMRVLRG